MNPLLSSFEMPREWDVCRISERYRITKKPRSLDVSAFEAVPFSPMEMVPFGGKREIEFGFKDGSDIRSGTYYEKGDFLLAKITPSFENGKQGLGGNIPLHFGYATTEVIPIQPLDERSSVKFLFYLLLHPAIRCDIANRMEGSTGRKRVPDHIVREYEIGIPKSPTEQRSITAILSKVQEAVEVEGDLIRVTRELKQAALQKLFTEGLRGEPQKETEIGLVPESWDVVELGELTDEGNGCIQTGPFGSQLHKSDYIDEGVPVVNPTHLLGNVIGHDRVPKISISKANELKRHRLRTGDILFARRGEIGRHGYVSESENGWQCGTGCFLVRVTSPRIFNPYLPYLFSISAIRDWLVAHAAGSIMPNLNNKVLSSLPVAFPKDPLEQREVASILQTIDAKIAHHESRQKLLQELFQRLLQDLMTGARRVNELDMEGLLKGGAST